MRFSFSHALHRRLLAGVSATMCLAASAPVHAQQAQGAAGDAGASQPESPPVAKEAAPASRPEPSIPPDQAPGAKKEDRADRHVGFHMRGELGLGQMSAMASVRGSKLEIGGLSSVVALSIGGAVVENLVLACELWSLRATGPDLTVDGTTVGTSSDISASLSGVGANVTYYLMPANVFLSVTPSVAALSVRSASDNTGAGTVAGFATRVAVGKEWWVARHLGIGLTGNLHLGFNRDQSATDTSQTTFYWTTLGFGAAFSASYN